MPEQAAILSSTPKIEKTRGARRFYLAMGIVAFVIVIAGFGPSMVNTSARKAPLNLSVALHAIIFTGWLVLFVIQAGLVSIRKTKAHRQLGYAGAALAALMIVTGYVTAIGMARRGFDLSGDLRAERDPLGLLVFQLGDLLSFSILVGAAVAYRSRPEVHKRLMLLATLGSLMAAPLVHLLSHFPALRDSRAPIILIPLVLLYSAHAVYDRLSSGRIHQVSLWGAVALFVWANLRAAVIGPSDAWRKFAAWLVG